MVRQLVCLLLFSSIAVTSQARERDDYFLLQLLTSAPEFEEKYTADVQPSWYSVIGNDALIGDRITDQYYTNALRVSALYHIPRGFLFDGLRLFGFRCADGEAQPGEYCELPLGRSTNRDLKLVSYGYTMQHSMYTPYEHAGRGSVDNYGYENLSNARYYDRPFSAWLSAGRQLIIRGLDGYQAHEFSVGVVGPAAKGRWLQEKAHEYPFTGPSPIDGWNSQVADRLALQYSAKFATHLRHAPALYGDLRFNHFSLLEAGTIINRFGYGVELVGDWPRRRDCDYFSAAPMIQLSFAAKAEQGKVDMLRDLATQVQMYRDGPNYNPVRVYHQVNAFLQDITNVINACHDDSQCENNGLMDGEISALQSRAQDINRELRNSVLSSCQQMGVYTQVSVDASVHYVVSNYLIEGDIHVPRHADDNSSDALMRDGGVLEVTRKPVIFSASMGYRLGYADRYAIDFRYHYRSEETREQKTPHMWAELGFEVKQGWGYAVIPALLVIAAAHNQQNWPQ